MDNIIAAIIGALIPVVFQIIRDQREASERKKSEANSKKGGQIILPENSSASEARARKEREAQQAIEAKEMRSKAWRNTILAALLVGAIAYAASYALLPSHGFTPGLATTTPTAPSTLTPTIHPTSTITPSPTPAPLAQDWKLVWLKDDFGDSTNKGCLPTKTYNGDWQGNTSISNKEYVVQATRLKPDGSAVWQVFKLECRGVLMDFYMKVDVKFASPNPGTTAGVALWSTEDTQDYYLFEFKNSQEYRTMKYKGGSGATLDGDFQKSLAIKPNDWNTIEVVGTMDKIELYTNHQLVTTITDATYKSGYLGLFMRLTNQNAVGTWEFDNLEVRIPTEPAASQGYTIYDNFTADNGKWKVSGNEAKCPRKPEDGTLLMECYGSATEGVDLTLFPTDAEVATSSGIEMALNTLPQAQGTNQWGKYQLQMRAGSSCADGRFPRTYSVSIRPNELTFVETDGRYTTIPPFPKISIGTLEHHVIKIEFEAGQINYYLDRVFIRRVAQYQSATPICWMFQSEDNGTNKPDGYRSIRLMWIATKP